MSSTRSLTACARELSGLSAVVAVDVLAADPRVDGSCLEVTLADCERVPPAVCRCIGSHDLGIHAASRRGEPTHYTVVVV